MVDDQKDRNQKENKKKSNNIALLLIKEMLWLIILLVILIVWWYVSEDHQENFYGDRFGSWGRFPIRYDPSLYYNYDIGYYESPYVLYRRRPSFQDPMIINKPYWECFEKNVAIGMSDTDAYKMCRVFI